MNFVSIRMITADIKRLVRFYEQITGISVTMYTEDFGELRTPACTLAIGSTRTLQLFGGEVASPASNRSVIIEFRVDDVDAEYRKLAHVIGPSLVQTPTTMPWGALISRPRRSSGQLFHARERGGDQEIRPVRALKQLALSKSRSRFSHCGPLCVSQPIRAGEGEPERT